MVGYISDALRQSIQGWLSASRTQSLAPPARDRSITVSAENAPIPIAYGEVSLPGMVFAVGTISTDLVVGVAWGYGEFQAIDDIYISDQAVPIAGVTVTNYLGTTTQTTDATLAAAIAAFNDDMVLRLPSGDIGIAYSVFRITPAAIDSAPRFQAVVRGRKVYDPRTATTGYSDNSALCWGDLATNPIFGMGVTVSGLAEAADWCDELLGGIVPRCRLSLALTQPQRTIEYLSLLATYAELIWYWEGSDIVVIPDRALSFASEADAKGQDALNYDSESIAEVYAAEDYFAEDYESDTALIYTNWTVGAGWVFRPGLPAIQVSGSTVSLSQDVQESGETKYAARFSIESITAGSVALKFNGNEVIAAKTATGDYSAIVTGSFSGPDNFELVGDSFRGTVSPIELQRFIPVEDNCIAGTLSVEGVDDGDTPTKVNVRYTQSSSTSGYWTDALISQSLPGVDEGEAPLIESTLSLPGVTRAEEAGNKALARLEQMKNRVTVSWTTADKGIVHRKGDVIRHKMGARGTDILVRIQSVQMVSYGRYRVIGTRYDPAHYPSELVLPGDTGTIPVGAILPLSGSTVPDGWEDYTAANGNYIIGAGGTYAVGDAGGDSLTIGPFNGNTSANDMHEIGAGGTFLTKIYTLGPSGSPFPRYLGPFDPNTTHDHTYSISSFTVSPLRRHNRLVIKTGAGATSIPKELTVFGLPNLLLAGLSRVTASANRMLFADSANSDAGSSTQSVSAALSVVDLAHQHYSVGDRGQEDLALNATWFPYDSIGTTHSHSATIPVAFNPKKKTLALWGSGEDFAIIPGMIVLWSGSLAALPADWVLCDGSGTTPDLRDYFITIAPVGEENIATGDNTLSLTALTAYSYHSHALSAVNSNTPVASVVHAEEGGHRHAFEISQNLTPPYYALGAIMYSP